MLKIFLLIPFCCFAVTNSSVLLTVDQIKSQLNYIESINPVLYGYDGDILRGSITISNEPAGSFNTPAFRLWYDCNTNDCDWIITEDGVNIYASLMYINGQLPGRAENRISREWDMFCTSLRFRGTRVVFGQFDDYTSGGPGNSSHVVLGNMVPISRARPFGYSVPLVFDTRGYILGSRNPGIFTKCTGDNSYEMIFASHIPNAKSPWEISVNPSNAIVWAKFEQNGTNSNLNINTSLSINGTKSISTNISVGTNTLTFKNGLLIGVK